MLNSRGPRVLVVDDDPMMLELITTRLDLAGYEAHGCGDGLQALNRLRDLKPAAMVLDINMPKMDGFAVLKRLREMGRLPGLPVMVLTARHEISDVHAAMSLGARDYLAKPFNDKQFLMRMVRLLRPAVTPPIAPRDSNSLFI